MRQAKLPKFGYILRNVSSSLTIHFVYIFYFVYEDLTLNVNKQKIPLFPTEVYVEFEQVDCATLAQPRQSDVPALWSCKYLENLCLPVGPPSRHRSQTTRFLGGSTASDLGQQQSRRLSTPRRSSSRGVLIADTFAAVKPHSITPHDSLGAPLQDNPSSPTTCPRPINLTCPKSNLKLGTRRPRFEPWASISAFYCFAWC